MVSAGENGRKYVSTLDPSVKVQGTNDLLSTPKANHQRSDSSYSNNYSLLDIYEMESPHIGSPEVKDDGFIDRTMVNSNGDETMESVNDDTIEIQDDDIGCRESYVKPTINANVEDLLHSQFDRYGFKKASTHHNITKEAYDQWFRDYSQYTLKRKKKWHFLMKSNRLGLDSDEACPTRFPPKSDKVKKMVRKGIPAEWRGNAWFFYAGGHERLNKHIESMNK